MLRSDKSGALFIGFGCLLLASCDQAGTPLCGLDQILATAENRQLSCVPAPGGKVEPPPCPTTLSSDGRSLLCTSLNESTDRDPDVRAALDALEQKTASLELRVVRENPLLRARYVGVTKMPTRARVVSGGKTGLTAAAELCAANFGEGAHLCAMDELYRAVTAGSITATSTIPRAWAYVPNWNMPITGAERPQQGVADTCNSYTYELGARRWVGILVEWGPLPDGTPGFRWQGGSAAPCSSTYPLACCK